MTNDPTKAIKNKITQKLKSLKDEGTITYKQYMETKPDRSQNVRPPESFQELHRPAIQTDSVLHRQLHLYSIAKAMSSLINQLLVKQSTI